MCDEMCKTFPNESGRGCEKTFRLNPGYICMLTLLMWSNHFFWTLYTIFFVAFCTLNRQYFMAHTYITFSEKIYYLSIYRICHEVYVCMWVCARKKSFVFPNESPKSHRVVIASCSIEIFRFLAISIVEEKNGYFCQVLPVFWAFPVRGPISITSRACERSNDGPKDRKCPKNGQNEAEIPIFQLNN